MVVMHEGTNIKVASLSMHDTRDGANMDVDMIVTTPSILETKSHLRGSAQRMALLGVELYGNQMLKYNLNHTDDMESGSVFMEHALIDLLLATEADSDARHQIAGWAYHSSIESPKSCTGMVRNRTRTYA